MSRTRWGAATVYETSARGDTTCRVCRGAIADGSPCLARHWHDAKGISHQACGYWVLDDLATTVREQLRQHVMGAAIDREMATAFLFADLRGRDGKWTKKGERMLARVKESEAA